MASPKETLREIENVQRGMQRVVQKLGELRQRQVSTQKMRALSLEEAQAALASQAQAQAQAHAHAHADDEKPVPSQAPETQPTPVAQESDDPPPFRPSMPPRSSTYSHVAPPSVRKVGKREP